MGVRRLIAAAVLVVSAAGCGYGIKAATDYDRAINFANYGTFFMVKGNSSGNSVIDARLKLDVENALAAKGWAEVPEGEGQAVVVIHTATGTEHTYQSFYSAWGGWRPRWASSAVTFAEDYKPGTVVVTIFDADSKQAIWRGLAADAISDDSKSAIRVREHAVATMFAKFPPTQ